jgi:predicted DsbA family dithiol-disulfide isomerase
VGEHIQEKYGSTPEQSAGMRGMIKDRAAALGFVMNSSADSRIYNTFDAHRLLHWAGEQGRQIELKRALFDAYFTEQANVSDPEVLVGKAVAVGLDGEEARRVLASNRYAEHVRSAEHAWQEAGISAVPTVVINDKYMISGGQPAEVFERLVRKILEKEAAAA